MQQCPECQAVVDDEATFCDQCGHRLKPPLGPGATTFAAPPPAAPDAPGNQSACPTCGYVNLPNEIFCVNCGGQLAPVSPAAPLVERSKPETAHPLESVEEALLVQAGPRLRNCPTCGADNPVEEEFCKSCGFWLKPGAQPAAPPPVAIPETPGLSPAKPTPSAYETVSAAHSAGRLLSTATNASLPLPAQAEMIIGRRDPERGISPDIDLSGQGNTSSSVSRQHARLLVQGNQVFIEDLNSTNSTYLNRQRLQPGQRYLVNSGDELRLGGVVLVYYSSQA